MLNKILQRGISVVLVFGLIFSLINFNYVNTVSAEFSTDVVDKQLMQEELSTQLNSLIESDKLSNEDVQELVDTDNVESDILSKLSQGEGEVELLGQKTVVYALDKNTGEAIEVAMASTDNMASEAEEDSSQGVSLNAKNNDIVLAADKGALLYFTVVFNYIVANKGYFTAKFVQTGTVVSVVGVGEKPKSYSIILSNRGATTKNGAYTTIKGVTKTVQLKSDVVLETQTTNTRYWKGVGNAYANYSDGTSYPIKEQISDPFLLNKKGFVYPLGYKDPQSGIKMWEPPTNLPVNPRTKKSTYREDFIEKYYEINWGPPTRYSWGDVQIHHMKPVKYNGPDSYDNLIPLWKPGSTPKNGILNHSELTTWWVNY